MQKDKIKDISELTKDYEKVVKGKVLNGASKDDFEQAVKKAVKPKQRGSK